MRYLVHPLALTLALAISLGLPQVLLGQPEDKSLAFEAAKDGKAVVSAWIGGGPGLRDYREEDNLEVESSGNMGNIAVRRLVNKLA